MHTISPSRLHIHSIAPTHHPDVAEGQDVIAGLTQFPKTLPPQYFYDDVGSQLFEQICELPEYYPTRTEAWILAEYAEAIATQTGPCELVELGSGSSTKTRLLLDAYQRQSHSLHYLPIDVSAGILVDSAKQLLADYPTLHINGQVGTYDQALAALPPSTLPHRMMFFLGSSLGNFSPDDCDRFFAQVTAILNPDDYFLLGIDLQKDTTVLEAAYNDAQGVTAAFNLNMLTHLNRRFSGNFDPSQFQHRAIYNPVEAQIEMYLYAKTAHAVTLTDLELTVDFANGEQLQTEISRKFNMATMRAYLAARGLPPVQIWTDPKQWFAIALCQRQS